MSTTTEISWTDKTWNPTTGCDRVSPGCDHCYALTMAKRLKGMGSAKYQNDGDPRTSGPGFLATEHESELDAPLRWRKPAKVFVNSMSDLFHDRISDEFIAKVFAVMAATPRHTFQVLTKRHARMRALLNRGDFGEQVLDWGRATMRARDSRPRVIEQTWPLPNLWLGVSVEDQKWAGIRTDALRKTPAAVRFLSCEPLLGPLPNLDLTGIDWVICGGESGPGARPMHPDWARQLRDQCTAADVPFHFKQWGEWGPAPWSVRIPEPDGGWRGVDAGWLADEKRKAEAAGATHHIMASGHLYEPDHKPWSLERDPNGDYSGAVRRWGKKAAGRHLDGRTWDEYPTEVAR